MRIDQEYEVVAIGGDTDVIREHPMNPNKGDDGVVEESIDTNTWYGAIIAQRSTGYILAGHTRYRVALRKGATEVPVIWKDCDDEAAKRILLVDNESNRRGVMDEAKLSDILESLEDITGTGYPLDYAERLIGRKGQDNGGGPDDDGEDEPDGLDEPDDDIPDDKYKKQFAVIVMCDSEDDQEDIYKYLQSQMADGEFSERELRVVAI